MNPLFVMFVCVVVSVEVLVQSASIVKRDLSCIEFNIPRAMHAEDKISLIGNVKTDKKSVTLKLVKVNHETGGPDYANVPCQIKMLFPHDGSPRDTITYNSIVNGKPTEEEDEQLEVSQLLHGNRFNVTYIRKSDEKVEVDINKAQTSIDCVWTDDIKFLVIEGDFHKLEEFSFILG